MAKVTGQTIAAAFEKMYNSELDHFQKLKKFTLAQAQTHAHQMAVAKTAGILGIKQSKVREAIQ